MSREVLKREAAFEYRFCRPPPDSIVFCADCLCSGNRCSVLKSGPRELKRECHGGGSFQGRGRFHGPDGVRSARYVRFELRRVAVESSDELRRTSSLRRSGSAQRSRYTPRIPGAVVHGGKPASPRTLRVDGKVGVDELHVPSGERPVGSERCCAEVDLVSAVGKFEGCDFAAWCCHETGEVDVVNSSGDVPCVEVGCQADLAFEIPDFLGTLCNSCKVCPVSRPIGSGSHSVVAGGAG